MAVKDTEVPAAIARLPGVTARDFNVAEVTVNVAGGLPTAPRAARICVEPALMPRTNPEPIPMLAMLVLVELQEALLVTSCWVPSLNVPMAENCRVPLRARDAVVGVTAMD